MTDDIVTRLKTRADRTDFIDDSQIMRESADEIERLRELGDALAATGGQHGFDEALDAWKDYRHG